MQRITTSNLLVWDNISNIPFPPEVKDLVGEHIWTEQEWNVQGLPSHFAKYNMLDGKMLYLEELPNGQAKTRKIEWTGDIYMATFIIDAQKKGEYNYTVMFKVTLFKGEVKEVLFISLRKYPIKEFEESQKRMEKNIMQAVKRTKSIWYRFLYTPWKYFVRIPVTLFITILRGIEWLAYKAGMFLTPWD